jgi:regulator of RNase E activity RraB
MVTEEQIASFRETFETLAEKAGGEYDGWEAAAKP